MLFIYLSIDVFICLHTPSAHIHPIPVYHCFCIPCMFYFVFIVCAYIREKERKSIHPSTLCSGAAKPSLFSRRLGDTLLVLVLLLTPRPLTPLLVVFHSGVFTRHYLYAPLSLFCTFLRRFCLLFVRTFVFLLSSTPLLTLFIYWNVTHVVLVA
ncbi:hypothetical protein BJ912DRAFT_232057 [Pholiota molesta]|nr:hypothetical protein BJ912DRAFT_232057 [Pholiota molesta]